MGVKIIIPSSKEDDSIIIEGISMESISRASEKIHTIIDEVVKRQNLDYSHFISLSLAIHPELVDKLVNFQNSILVVSLNLSWLHFQSIVWVSLDAKAVRMMHFPLRPSV
ncbi:hypothetical protein CerSpe_107550 [Prunus speciosa]